MDENEEKNIEKLFNESGVKGLNKYAEEKLKEWKKTPVSLAVVGQSGTGKSTFINKIRDMYPKKTYKGPACPYAEVGSTQTTMDPMEYHIPGNEMIKLWDLPGSGTKDFSISTYADKMKFEKYDAFIILTANRFTENDSTIAEKIENMEKPFYFGRTKMDQVMISEKEENCLSEEDTKKKIVDDCRNNLGEGYETKRVYLLSKTDRKKYTPDDDEEPTIFFSFPDNEEIKKALIEDLPSIQRTALVLSIAAKSHDMITEKVKELNSRIIWCALGSGIFNAIPLPGLDTAAFDLSIVASEIDFQLKQLGIDGDSIKEKAEKQDMTLQQFKQAIIVVAVGESNIPGFISVSFVEKLFDFLLTVKSDSHCVTRGFILSLFKAGTAAAVGTAAVRLIPVLGGVVGATGTATVLHVILKGNEAVARACITMTKK